MLLFAAGSEVQVHLTGLDGRPLAEAEHTQPIWFGHVAVGAAQTRVVRVQNATQLPLPFCWQQTDEPVSEGTPLSFLATALACLELLPLPVCSYTALGLNAYACRCLSALHWVCLTVLAFLTRLQQHILQLQVNEHAVFAAYASPT